VLIALTEIAKQCRPRYLSQYSDYNTSPTTGVRLPAEARILLFTTSFISALRFSGPLTQLEPGTPSPKVKRLEASSFIYFRDYECVNYFPLHHTSSGRNVSIHCSIDFVNLCRGISPSQGRYLHTEQHKHGINAHRHPCLEWDSNVRSQCLSGRRRFMLYDARPP
jgi:hypothetical protein